MPARRSPVGNWKPASQAWTNAFLEATAHDERLQHRKMFGYPAVFVNGNMAAGLHQDGLVLRLSDSDRDEMIESGGRTFEPMPGRPMRGFAVAPESLAHASDQLRGWLDRAIAHTASLPGKTEGTKSQRPKRARRD